MTRKLAAEFLGTFWLVFGGCGSAVLAVKFPGVGIGLVGVALAFGLTVLTMAYAIGHISGCHLNPAVTLGLWAGDRFEGREILPYWVSQVVGAIVAAGLLAFIAGGAPGFDISINGLAQNGYGSASPGQYTLAAGCSACRRADRGSRLPNALRTGAEAAGHRRRREATLGDQNGVVGFSQHVGIIEDVVEAAALMPA